VAAEWLQLFGVPLPEALQPEPEAHASPLNGEAAAAVN
jgi:hypothetical protein